MYIAVYNNHNNCTRYTSAVSPWIIEIFTFGEGSLHHGTWQVAPVRIIRAN